jgi:hypothetical protein
LEKENFDSLKRKILTVWKGKICQAPVDPQQNLPKNTQRQDKQDEKEKNRNK